MAKKSNIDVVAFVLVMLGALNVGLAALGWDILDMILGGMPMVLKILNILIGVSALYMIYAHTKK